MRIAASKLILAAGLALCLVTLGAARPVKAAGGLTLTPATLTLSLAKGATQETAEFSVINHYDKLVTLHFAFEKAADTPDGIDPAKYLRISQSHVLLEAGKGLKQVVSLTDSDSLAPGSLPADLVITQTNSGARNVGVLPSIRMPLVLVKEDGAVSALALAKLAGPGFSLMMPNSVTATIRNSGNMIAIPRGLITVVGPGGQVHSGALNTASLAVTPGKTLALATPLHALKRALWPGVYRVNVSYGLGSGQIGQTASTWFFYIAWWHILLLAPLSVAVVYGRKRIVKAWRQFGRAQRSPHPPPKRPLLIGRDIS